MSAREASDPVGSVWHVQLRVVRPGTLPAWTGSVAMAAVLSAFARIDPELAAGLHDIEGPKPYTVSPLSGGALPAERTDRLALAEGASVAFRLTAVGEAQRAFAYLLERLGSQLLLLDRAVATVEDVAEDRVVSLGDLLAPALGTRLRLRFRTPTAIRNPAGPLELLPTPACVLGAAERRWRLWLSTEPPAVRDGAAWVRAHRIRTVPVRLAEGSITGFVGSVDVQCSEGQAQGVWALCRYLELAGCGVKSSQGMGQVTVEAALPRHEDVPPRDRARSRPVAQGGSPPGPP